MPTTARPPSSSRRARQKPMKPAAPVTKTGWSDIQYLSAPSSRRRSADARFPTRPAPNTVRSSCGRVYDALAMADELATSLSLRGAATVAIAALLSALLIVLLRPVLVRYALARPNVRSSHTTPTPQGGGIAVVAATIGGFYAAAHFSPGVSLLSGSLLTTLAAVVLVAGVGAADDVRSIAVVPRLLLQALAVVLVIYALPDELRVAPFLPWWTERVLLVIGGVWFVNLVNFMDGLDWMTVAEVVPVTAALALMGAFGALPPQ